MQGLIEKIAVLVLDSSGCVVERFTMQLKVTHNLAALRFPASEPRVVLSACVTDMIPDRRQAGRQGGLRCDVSMHPCPDSQQKW